MKAVIPIAKKKDSMFPFSETRPTGLMPVMGKPLVNHLISQLQEAGVDDIYLVTNYMEEEFEEVFEEYTNVNLVHQEELSGTAEAVACCEFIEEDFFIVNGDVMVSKRDLENLLQKHEGSEGDLTMLATEGNHPEKFGVLSITNDRVESVEEKPERAESTLVNTGIYIFDPGIFEHIDELESGDLTDAVDSMIGEKNARFQLVEDYWFDIGSPRKLLKADRVKREHEIDSGFIHKEAEISDSAEVGENVYIEKGAVVRSNSVIEDYSYIGKDSVIGPNSVVRNSSMVGGCEIEDCSVRSSLIFERGIVEPNVSVARSILGEETEINSGTVVRESFIGSGSFIEMNNSVRGAKFVPDARTDLGEISK